MLAGKAVIGAAGGGTRELIRDGYTGLLYPPGNYLELAAKIRYLHENVEERLRLGLAARNWARNRFPREKYAKEVISVFKEVIGDERRQSG
jgi:glycosyltransferase involved in cell wall biosynthesis